MNCPAGSLRDSRLVLNSGPVLGESSYERIVHNRRPIPSTDARGPDQRGLPGSSDGPVVSACLRRAKRDSGLDWPHQALTMIGRIRLRSLRECCESALRRGIPGDFVETGICAAGPVS